MKRITKYKIISFFILYCIGSYTASGQKTFNNSVKTHSGGFHFAKHNNPNKLTSLIGISYERMMFQNISLSGGYSQWRGLGGGMKAEVVENTDPFASVATVPGTILARRGYKMADLSVRYSQNIYKRKHFIKAGVGLSYCWGANICVQERHWIQEHGWIGTDYEDKVGYMGVVPQIIYDFNFLRNRLNAGIDIRGRYYVNVPNHQYDVSLHAGVNF